MRRRRIGRYRIAERLGEGGSGVVYLAHTDDAAAGNGTTKCAIKTIRPNLVEDRGFVESLRQEARICARLEHPAIVRLIDFGESKGLYFLAMEYVEGISLKELLSRMGRLGRPLSVELSCHVAAEMARALHYAHAHRDEQDRSLGIVHRDVVPANIMVTATGSVKLLDFGIATAAEHLRHHQTGSGLIKGTLGYLSPEQANGKSLDGRSDLFSLGVVLYECLTGSNLFHGRNALHSLQLLRQMGVTPPSRLRAEVSPALDHIVLTLLAQNPDDRFANGQVVVDALTPVLREFEAAVSAAPAPGAEGRPGSDPPLSPAARLGVLVAELRRSDPKPLPGEAGPISRWTRVLPMRGQPTPWRAWLGLTSIAASLAALVWLLSTRAPSATEAAPRLATAAALRSPAKRSVAVLGFRNVLGRADARWISSALGEILLSKLEQPGRLRRVNVEELGRVKAELKVRETDALSREELYRVGRNLAADLVVVGSVAVGDPAADLVRIQLRVQDTGRATTLASASGSASARELFALATRLGDDLNKQLDVAAGSSAASDQALRASVPSNLQALRWYAEGLARLRVQDAAAARDLLEKAAAAEPNHALTHLALAQSWALLGYATRAQSEARKALSLASDLSREQRLFVKGYVNELDRRWSEAIDAYETLCNFVPDNLDYGLALASAQRKAGKPEQALATLARLRALPEPQGADPRIYLEMVASSRDPAERLAAARTAKQKARARGAALLEADAQLAEVWALSDDAGRCPEAIRLAESIKAPLAQAQRWSEVLAAQNLIGTCWHRIGDTAAELRAAEENLALSEKLGNRERVAQILGNMAWSLRRLGRRPEGLPLMQRSQAIAREIDSPELVSSALRYLASEAADGGDLAAAKRRIREAIDARQRSGRGSLVGPLHDAARFHLESAEVTDARRLANHALTLARLERIPARMVDALVLDAQLLRAADKLPEAHKALAEAQALPGEKDAGYLAVQLCEQALAEGDLATAWASAQQALQLVQGWSTRKVAAHELLARVALARGQVKPAREELRSAQAAIPGDGLPFALNARLQITRAQVEAAGGKEEEARQSLWRTRTACEKARFVERALEARLALLALRAPGSRELQRLRQEAGRLGLTHIARLASAARKPVPPALARSPARGRRSVPLSDNVARDRTPIPLSDTFGTATIPRW